MRACLYGRIEFARTLASEFNAIIDLQNTVRAISRSCLCDDDVRACRVGLVVNVVVVAEIVALLVSVFPTTLSIAPLHLVAMDAIC